MSSFKIIAKLRGLPLHIKRRAGRISRHFAAAFTNKALIKVIMRAPGALIDPSFNPYIVKQYDAVGRCIYCGISGSSVKLSREHILAYSLGGDAILPAASCPTCAGITSSFEKYCADHIFLSTRVHHKVHSRRPMPTHLPIHKSFAAAPYLPHKVEVPVNDHLGFLVLPSFDPPGLVMKYEQAPLEDPGLKWHTYSLASDHNERVKRLKEAGHNGALKIVGEFDLDLFLRMLAKIAHGMAVADYGIDGFRPLLIDIILKGDLSAPYFVGSATDRTPPPEPMKTWARTETRSIGSKNYVVAFFRLFAYLGTPVYTVVVGERTAQ